MKNDSKLLAKKKKKKVGKEINLSSDFDRRERIFGKHNVLVKSQALKKVWGFLKGKEKPSKETLDKVALFAGFQDWESFQKALHGDSED